MPRFGPHSEVTGREKERENAQARDSASICGQESGPRVSWDYY